MPAENRAAYEKIFMQECQGKPYLTGIEAAIVFLDSHLHKHVLSNIWEQADVTRDGRFSCDEFCLAMWLIDKEKGNDSSMLHHQSAAQITPASTVQHSSSSAQPPAYSQQPQHDLQPNHLTYRVPQPPETLPQLTTACTLQHFRRREMIEPLICRGCETGLVPGDIAYCCDECKHGASTICKSCHDGGKRCHHEVAPEELEAGKDLKNEDQDGDFGFGLKCDGCKAKLKQGMLCWHCKRCFDPNFCKDCWRRRDKRCKHAVQGKIQLRRVRKSSATEQILDGLETVGAIFGG
ncbi:hypothetical protein MY3957_008390 [Beauveria namnaoensis]